MMSGGFEERINRNECKGFTRWSSLNQSPASMVKSPAGGGKGTGMRGRLQILMPPNAPAALCIPRDGK